MRIEDKIDEIDKLLDELIEIMPNDFNEYNSDFKTKAACERYFEKIIEAAIDLAFLVIKDRRLQLPEEDKRVFDILSREKLISEDLAIKLKEAKGMRNIIAHKYGKIDDELVFNAITDELIDDMTEFITALRRIKPKDL